MVTKAELISLYLNTVIGSCRILVTDNKQVKKIIYYTNKNMGKDKFKVFEALYTVYFTTVAVM